MRTLCQKIEIALSQLAWDAALRPLLFAFGGAAVGNLRRLRLSDGLRLIAERTEIAPTLPRGIVRPPMSDWLVIVVDRGSGDSAWTPERLLAEVAPRASQGIAAVTIRPGRGDARRVGGQLGGAGETAWDAAWFDEGEISPIEAVQIVGPGMLRLDHAASAAPPAMNEYDLRRWSRAIGPLGSRAFQKLRRSRVTLVGCGRNGSAAAFQLAALGVPLLRLVDDDLLELENLDAMPGLAAIDVGRPKVEALAHRLIEFRPDLAVTCLARSITDSDLVAELSGLPTDLIVSAVDRNAGRLAASLLARETLTPHLDVGANIQWADTGELLMSGDARLLLPGQGCASCVGGMSDQDQAFYELAAPSGALRRGEPRAFSEERVGSLITLNSLTISAGVQLWLDLLAGRLGASFWQRLRWVQGQGIEASGGAVGAGEGCPFCRPSR